MNSRGKGGFFSKQKKKKQAYHFTDRTVKRKGRQDNEAGKGRVSEAWMTACDATLVTLQEDRGVCTASLALSLLMVIACVHMCVCGCGGGARVCMRTLVVSQDEARGVFEPTMPCV